MNNSILFVPMHLDALVLGMPQNVVQPKADFTKLPYYDGQQDRNSDRSYISEVLLSQPFADQSLLLEAGVHLHWALPDGLTGTMSMPIIYQDVFMSVFGTAQGKRIWQHLHTIGWLQPFTGHGFWAKIQPKERRDPTNLAPDYVQQYVTINSLLNHPSFVPAPNRWLVTRSGAGPTVEWIVESDYLYPYGQGGGQGGDEGEGSGSISYPVHTDVPNQPPFRYLGRKVPRHI